MPAPALPNPPLELGADLVFASTLTCPACGARATETMPTNACWFFYDCLACGARLKPTRGKCCVFCVYGTVPCPPMQATAGRQHPPA